MAPITVVDTPPPQARLTIREVALLERGHRIAGRGRVVDVNRDWSPTAWRVTVENLDGRRGWYVWPPGQEVAVWEGDEPAAGGDS